MLLSFPILEVRKVALYNPSSAGHGHHSAKSSTMAAAARFNDSTTSSEDGFDESEKLLSTSQQSQRQRLVRKENIGWALLACCLVGLTIGLSVGVAIVVVRGWHGRSSASCLEESSSPSPITRDLEITYHTQQFNGTFLNENIYRQAGSPEVDAAWEALGVNCKLLFNALLFIAGD